MSCLLRVNQIWGFIPSKINKILIFKRLNVKLFDEIQYFKQNHDLGRGQKGQNHISLGLQDQSFEVPDRAGVKPKYHFAFG